MLKVLCLVSHYLPGYKAGGALRSVASMANALGDSCQFSILTADRDLGDTSAYDCVPLDHWTVVGRSSVLYARRPCWSSLRELRQGAWNVLYLNSFFSRCFSMIPVAAAAIVRKNLTVVLAPRGEFSPGALGIKRRRKRLFVIFARASGLYRRVVWHASTDIEAQDIRLAMGRTVGQIKISSDIPTLDHSLPNKICEDRLVTDRNPLRVCYVSRVSPKKNLEYALHVLKKAAVHVCFDIYGPVEDFAYASKCQNIAMSMPAQVKVNFRGPLRHECIISQIAEYHLFLLPTLGENFGHVVAESLAAGTPVLISDQTPWRGLRKAGVGWDVSLSNPDEFVDIVRGLVAMGPAEYREMRRSARQYDYGMSIDQKREELLDLLAPTGTARRPSV